MTTKVVHLLGTYIQNLLANYFLSLSHLLWTNPTNRWDSIWTRIIWNRLYSWIYIFSSASSNIRFTLEKPFKFRRCDISDNIEKIITTRMTENTEEIKYFLCSLFYHRFQQCVKKGSGRSFLWTGKRIFQKWPEWQTIITSSYLSGFFSLFFRRTY